MNKKRYYKFLALMTSIFMFMNGCTGKTKIADVTINTTEVDAQSYFGTFCHNVTKGEQGYYYTSSVDDYIVVNYVDTPSGTSVPLCGKADCMHNNLTCNAYFASSAILLDTIYYYKGYVYLIGCIGSNASLIRMEEDGTNRETLFSIGTTNGGSSIRLLFNDDYVYISNDSGCLGMQNEAEVSIQRYALDGSSQEKIFGYTGGQVAIKNARCYGDKIFFTIEGMNYDSSNNNKAEFSGKGLYVYDCSTGESQQYIDQWISDYSIDQEQNEIYYYVTGDGLYKMNMEEKKPVQIYKAEESTYMVNMSFDGNYIYMDNRYWSNMCDYNSMVLGEKSDISTVINVCSLDGEIMNTIGGDILHIYYGDEEYMFALVKHGTQYVTAYIDKKIITTATEDDWTILK